MDSLSPESLAEMLTRRLRHRQTLPKPRMAPQLSYGRHRGPSHRSSRLAAVAVALYRDPQQGWIVPLTLRPRTLQHHAGQVCLPGGQIEPAEDAAAAAIREFEEELGITPVVECHCGALSTQYVYASGNLVHPVVMIVQAPSEPWSPDPLEVAEVIPLPLDVLLQPQHRRQIIRQRGVRVGDQEVDRLRFRADAIRYHGHSVWGATALILDQLAQILRPDG
jgi:8-oxo-dGTP pyrophosphatase MutT (NUDIX family)